MDASYFDCIGNQIMMEQEDGLGEGFLLGGVLG